MSLTQEFACVAQDIRKAQLEVPFPWFPLSYSLSLLQSPGLSCSSPFDLFPFPVGEKHSDAFFFKIHVNQFLAQDDSPAANVTSRHVVGEGPGAIPWDSAFLSLADC